MPRSVSRRPFIVAGYAAAAVIGAVLCVGSLSRAFADDDVRRSFDPCRRLACTDAQRDDVRAVIAQLDADTRDDVVALRETTKAWAEAYRDDGIDVARLEQLRREIEARRAVLTDRRHDALVELHPLLSVEQRGKAVRLLDRPGHHRRWAHRHGDDRRDDKQWRRRSKARSGSGG